MLLLATLPPVQLLGDDPKHGGGSDWWALEGCLGGCSRQREMFIYLHI